MGTRPSFLMIVTDQQPFDHVGFAGNPIVRTPHLDGLAAAGTWLRDFYVASPTCMSNRATMMTARMPSLHRVRQNGIPLGLESVTFVDLLLEAGYRTALVGKCHLQNTTALAPAYEREQFPADWTLPPPSLRDAVRRWGAEADYGNEDGPAWREGSVRDVRTPYYGFGEVDLCVGHGDDVTGHYEHWLRESAPEFLTRRGSAEASVQSACGAPQTYRPAIPAELHPSTYVANRAVEFLEGAGGDDRPFFLQVNFPDPHHPFAPPGRYWDMYDPAAVELPGSFNASSRDQTPALRGLQAAFLAGEPLTRWTLPFITDEARARDIVAKTYGQVSLIDDGVGRMLDALRASGRADDTVVIYTSDHGDWMGSHGLFLKGPLHYQRLIRVPFVWRDPVAHYNRGALPGEAGSIDIARTVLARAGLAPSTGMQGCNLLPAIAAGALPSRAFLVEQAAQYAYLGFAQPFRVHTLVDRDWRLSIWQGVPWGELYDLRNDPEELHNLFDAPRAAAIKAKLLLRLIHAVQDHADDAPFPARRA